MKYYLEKKETVLRDVHSSADGLSAQEAQRRLDENGRNRLSAPPGKPLILRFFEQMADPMIIILLIAAAISGVLAVVEGESFADVVDYFADSVGNNLHQQENKVSSVSFPIFPL